MRFTSAKLQTKADWLYGKFHVRSRLLGAARGTWAAHWMMPTKSLYGIWPHSGEIDIMEHVGYDLGKVYGTVHTGAYHHSIGTEVGGMTQVNVAAWHTWTVEWRPDIMLFACDDEVYQIFRSEGDDTEKWPFDHKFYVILNYAVGGNWGGQQGIDEPAFKGEGQVIEVDWVRVEQRN
jgi:beta-glucanase (GH16 family)